LCFNAILRKFCIDPTTTFSSFKTSHLNFTRAVIKENLKYFLKLESFDVLSQTTNQSDTETELDYFAYDVFPNYNSKYLALQKNRNSFSHSDEFSLVIDGSQPRPPSLLEFWFYDEINQKMRFIQCNPIPEHIHKTAWISEKQFVCVSNLRLLMFEIAENAIKSTQLDFNVSWNFCHFPVNTESGYPKTLLFVKQIGLKLHPYLVDLRPNDSFSTIRKPRAISEFESWVFTKNGILFVNKISPKKYEFVFYKADQMQLFPYHTYPIECEFDFNITSFHITDGNLLRFVVKTRDYSREATYFINLLDWSIRKFDHHFLDEIAENIFLHTLHNTFYSEKYEEISDDLQLKKIVNSRAFLNYIQPKLKDEFFIYTRNEKRLYFINKYVFGYFNTKYNTPHLITVAK